MYIFSKYFSELMKQLGLKIYDVLILIKDFFVNLWHGIRVIFLGVGNVSGSYFQDFDVWAWILFVLVCLVVLLILGGLIYLIIKGIKRRIKIRKKYTKKEDMMDEIESLNDKVLDLMDENNKLMALKVSQLGIKPGSKESDLLKKLEKNADKRFIKLCYVDSINEDKEILDMDSEDMIDLKTLAERFRHYSAAKLKLYYDQKTINLFLAGVGAAKIIILEGISGTGKTSLPYAFGMFFQNKASIVSVQPSWRDRSELLGFLNEFTKRFNESEFLRELYKANYEKSVRLIVLDEMNLARIEYYFAEFLSMMEMPDADDRVIDLVSETLPNDPKFLLEGKIIVPPNVWFVGTANQDDSTFAVTDKVYDRAVSIVLNKRAEVFDADPAAESIYMEADYLNNLFEAAIKKHAVSEETLGKLEDIEKFMIDKFRLAFGNRIYLQIKKFVPIFVGCGGDELDGLDYIFTRKVLRKMENLHLNFIQKELKELLVKFDKLFGKDAFEESKDFVERLLKAY